MSDGVKSIGGRRVQPTLGESAKIGVPFWTNILMTSKSTSESYQTVKHDLEYNMLYTDYFLQAERLGGKLWTGETLLLSESKLWDASSVVLYRCGRTSCGEMLSGKTLL